MLIGIAVIGIAVYVGAPTWTIVFASHRLTYRPSLRGGLYLTQKNFYDIIYIESEG